jgi:hypothetical protein
MHVLWIASELGIPTQPFSVPMDVRALDGRSIEDVTHSTVPIQVWVSGNHSETIQFLLIASPHVPSVWATSSILGWSPFCHSQCLQAAQPSPCHLPQDVSKTVDASAIPTEYHDLLDVFSKARATSLPRTVLMTVPLIFSQALHHLGVGCILCPDQRPKLWRST